jgi:UDP-N-acetylmuramoyl-tripeptide--D-alanyl-D-alanine ligase
MSRTLHFLAQACGGRLVGEDREFAAVSIDSRTLDPGDLFVAVRGDRFDGHDFAAAAAERGACALVVSRQLPLDLPQLVVADTLAALASGARAWRQQFGLPLVGVGGSNGKTTTKELLAAILAKLGRTLATRGNLNNHIGVPLTLFRLEPTHQAAVVEMGANHAGEIASLVDIARPTVGLVTNAGAEHLEGFGSLEGVARAEGEMFAGLGGDATAVMNADDEFAPLWRELSTARRSVTFGIDSDADFRALAVSSGIEAGAWVSHFELATPAGRAPVRLALPGRHNVLNATAAAAAAWACGASLRQIVDGLAAVQPVRGRLQLKPALCGAWLIDDSYNANPTSALAGLEVLGGLDGERWLVLGEMAELGEHAAAGHAEVGAAARAQGVSRLFAVGPTTLHAVEAFGQGGHWFPDTDALAAAVRESMRPGVALLVKGSRVNRLERVVEVLVEAPPTACNGN